MTQSALATRVVPHHNKLSSRQGRAILKFLPHHWAGLGGGDARLMDPNQQASANYIIYNDGTIAVQVPEEYRAWTSGSFEADADAITVEVQNESTQINGNDDDPGSWRISQAAQNSLIRLAADIAKRYGWGAITLTNWVMHRMFYQTACPGGFMMANRPNFVNSAQALLTGQPGAVAPAAPPTAGKTIWQLADEVMAGVHGNGADRQRSLGANYAAVQAEVDRRFGAGAPAQSANNPSAPQKSVAQLADEVLAGAHGSGADRRVSLAGMYDAVQAEVNRRLGAGGSAGGPNISQLADAVLRGEFGNGEQRQAALGANYAAVQAEVDRRYNLAPAPAQKSISQLADEVLAGLHGNGDDRVRSLGANYTAVQNEINRRYS